MNIIKIEHAVTLSDEGIFHINESIEIDCHHGQLDKYFCSSGANGKPRFMGP